MCGAMKSGCGGWGMGLGRECRARRYVRTVLFCRGEFVLGLGIGFWGSGCEVGLRDGVGWVERRGYRM